MALIHISFSQLCLPIVVVLILAINAHAAIENPFCSKTAPGEEKILCNTLVNGAPTWDAAFTNVVQALEKEAAPIKPLMANVSSILPASLEDVSKDSIAKNCQESLDLYNDSINSVLNSVKTGDKSVSVDSELAAGFSGLTDCTDGIEEFNIKAPPQIQKLVDVAKSYINLSLVVFNAKPN